MELVDYLSIGLQQYDAIELQLKVKSHLETSVAYLIRGPPNQVAHKRTSSDTHHILVSHTLERNYTPKTPLARYNLREITYIRKLKNTLTEQL